MSTTVDKLGPEVKALREACAKGRALMGGTRAMREAGKKYLPRFESESDDSYSARLGSSWLFNGYRKTVRDMSGRVFDKPMEFVEGPNRLTDWVENVDLAGRDLSTFAKSVFEDGLSGPGISWVMVDAPPREGTVTRAQAEARNLRPYLVHLTVEDILGWRVGTINAVPTITQLRIMEKVREPDPKDEFADLEVEQIRVLDLDGGRVRTRLFRKDKEATWAQYEDERLSDMDRITVVPFYAARTGFWQAEPVLDDLADVNIAHWQSQSDQRNILHFARVPILFASGRAEDDGPLTISAGMATTASDPQAKLEWVEHSGQAIGAGRQDLKDLEFQMETHGLQLLAARPGAQSATGEALDAEKETSQLAMMADSLRDCFEQALSFMAAYAGEREASVSVEVNTDFGVNMMSAQELTVLLQAVQTGNLSRETFLTEMARRGMVRPDLDVEAELQRVADAAPAVSGDLLDLTDGA